MSPRSCGYAWPMPALTWRRKVRISRAARSHAGRRRRLPTDFCQPIWVFDGFDFLAFADLQRAVLHAAGVLADRRHSDLRDAALGDPEHREKLGGEQHLVAAGD